MENTLVETVGTYRTEKPEIIDQEFVALMTKTHMVPLDALPKKEHVKKKISYYKQKYKKAAMNVVV